MAQQLAHKGETYTVLLRTSDRVSGSTLQAPQWYVNLEAVLPSCHTKYQVKALLYGCPSINNNTSNSYTLLIHMSGLSLNVFDTYTSTHSDVVGICELYTSPYTSAGNPEYGIRPHARGLEGIVCTRPDTQLVKLSLTDLFNTNITPALGYIVYLQFTPVL